ncbi:tail fiber assembly protein [Enterobacter kobei]|uniref:tail fiber assembly protein n=1 Tax=Enterobacter kobei TaxID=208224 RepID=UPI0020057C8B|nr:tail fiber assembly protein [Enterobacter kobei]MCK6815585.1 tail fiber assembly protein [Enterobacter kobei]
MTTIYFSSENSGFYIEGTSDIPSDAVVVSTETYEAFAGVAWPDSKQLGSDSSGYPSWVDAPELTQDELIAAAELVKSRLLATAKETISLWQTELQLGSISDEDKASLISWLAYIKEVQAVDTSSAPDITWPTSPESQTS